MNTVKIIVDENVQTFKRVRRTGIDRWIHPFRPFKMVRKPAVMTFASPHTTIVHVMVHPDLEHRVLNMINCRVWRGGAIPDLDAEQLVRDVITQLTGEKVRE